ncbi:MAG TPA: hypothetical protein VJ951_07435 [Bacteroidales bacterium]|nr:hypothetical protein [Bacteroidales bacterium]
MKNALILLSCLSLLFLFSCQEDGAREVLNESSTASFHIPDSLAVYEMVNGEKKRSTRIRLLTDAERQKLIEEGVLQADDEVDLRAQTCEWKDTGESIECEDGAIDCGPAFVNGDLCLVCYDSGNTIMEYGACR